MNAALRWADACRAITLLGAVDRESKPLGLLIRAPHGPVREEIIAQLRATDPRSEVRIGAEITDQQLLGGLDLERTLAAGRPMLAAGAMERAGGGRLLISSAERLPPAMAALIAAHMDEHADLSLVLLDESEDGEPAPAAALIDRVSLVIDLTGLSHHDIQPLPEAATNRTTPTDIWVPDTAYTALSALSLALGLKSLRAPLQALAVAKTSAALAGRQAVIDDDVALAVRLCLAPRATQMPAMPGEEAPSPPPPPPSEADASDQAMKEQAGDQALEDRVVEKAMAALPAEVLELAAANAKRARQRGAGGKAGASMATGLRGRPIGSRRGELRQRQRIALLDTLRAAAPWQGARRRLDGREGLRIRKDDIRIRRFRERSASTTIFVVDASGSTAMERLAEAKGAIEMILADCYVRRDEVALIAFRGARAELLLPATRALERAKRALSALPGGGGTPLAAGLAAADRLADEVTRRGRTPTLVVITDGRANVARDGTGGRAEAQKEAELLASRIGERRLRAIVIDNSARPEPRAKALAERMGGAYLPLPRMNAGNIAAAVRAEAGGP